MDPVASLSRFERSLLRVSKDHGLRPFIIAITGVSIAMSVAISIPAIAITGPTGWELLLTAAIAVTVPAMVAPVAATLLGRLLLAIDHASSELRHLSRIDSLTGALNRRAFADDAAAMLAASPAGQFVLAMVDIDDFKGVNDQLGHAAGDAALVELTRRLTAAVAPDGIVGRFGGDEFVVVCRPPADAMEDAQRAIRAAGDLGAVVPGLWASAGIHAGLVDAVSLAEAMTRADHALYRSKRADRRHEYRPAAARR